MYIGKKQNNKHSIRVLGSCIKTRLKQFSTKKYFFLSQHKPYKLFTESKTLPITILFNNKCEAQINKKLSGSLKKRIFNIFYQI